MNASHFVKICQVLTILHQVICRGVANFGTRSTYIHTYTHSTTLCPGKSRWASTRKVKPIWYWNKRS